MVSTSKAVILPAEQGVGQGDVFKDVKYSYIDSEDGDSVEVMELTFPYALIVSQSCDVAYMDDFESGETSAAVKYMPSILMCPIYPNYLKDPRCEISNNRAENKIHPFTVGRKNWLFSDTPAGAKASAVIYSIVETAKANNLAPRDYIQFLFENLPDMEIQTHPERLDQMLPWGKLIQENFA